MPVNEPNNAAQQTVSRSSSGTVQTRPEHFNIAMRIVRSLPRHCRLTLFAALAGLTASCGSFLFPTLPVGLLSFYFAACWTLWILSTILGAGKMHGVLVAIWSIINVSILVMFLSITSSAGDVRGSQGTELIWAISYLPMLLPLGWTIAPSALTMTSLTVPLEAWLGASFGSVIGNWLGFAFVAAIQSLVIMLLAWAPVSLLALVLRSRGVPRRPARS